MGKAKIVNVGVDTLVLNAFYIDERGRPFKSELDPSLRSHLDEWKRAAQEVHEECPTTLIFNNAGCHAERCVKRRPQRGDFEGIILAEIVPLE